MRREPKTNIRIAIWNVRTLYHVGTMKNVCIEASKSLKLNILGISETKWSGNGRSAGDEYEFVYCGKDTHEHGVEILMKKQSAATVDE